VSLGRRQIVLAYFGGFGKFWQPASGYQLAGPLTAATIRWRVIRPQFKPAVQTHSSKENAMHPIPPHPSRRSVLRAASASVVAVAVVSAASVHATAASTLVPPRDNPGGGPLHPVPPDHRSIVGLL
jgi:hypothetical protein